MHVDAAGGSRRRRGGDLLENTQPAKEKRRPPIWNSKQYTWPTSEGPAAQKGEGIMRKGSSCRSAGPTVFSFFFLLLYSANAVLVDHFISMQSSKTHQPVSFALSQNSWVEVTLPSMEVELILMFNSSVDDKCPRYDVFGTFCPDQKREELFGKLKGPVSKMISRTDLGSLKSRTKCEGEGEVKTASPLPKVYLMTQPITASSEYTATLTTLLLINQTAVTASVESKAAATHNPNQANPVSQQLPTAAHNAAPPQPVVDQVAGTLAQVNAASVPQAVVQQAPTQTAANALNPPAAAQAVQPVSVGQPARVPQQAQPVSTILSERAVPVQQAAPVQPAENRLRQSGSPAYPQPVQQPQSGPQSGQLAQPVAAQPIINSQPILEAILPVQAPNPNVQPAQPILIALPPSNQGRRKKRSDPSTILKSNIVINQTALKVLAKIVQSDHPGLKCISVVQLSADKCTPVKDLTTTDGQVEVDVKDVLKCADYSIPFELHVTATVSCEGGEVKGVHLEVSLPENPNTRLLYIWMPLVVLLISISIVIVLFVVYQRIRSSKRHRFQRQTALSRTMSDPRPRPKTVDVRTDNQM